MFPWMIAIVLTMLGLMRIGYELSRWKGIVLVVLCGVYLVNLFMTNPGALQVPGH